MIQLCPSCKKSYDKYKDQLCRDCYTENILRGQCLNLAHTELLKAEHNPEHEDFNEKLFKKAKKLFEDAKKYGWK